MKLTLIFVSILLLALPVVAEQATQASPTPETEQGETPEQGEVPQQGEPDQASPDAPTGEQLRSRELGEAFRIFRPSEEISADNAVPFPVDI